jgi:hypothetical protein
MRLPTRGGAALLLAGATLASPRARAADATFLPDLSLHLSGAHYAPAGPSLQWTTWIGGGFELLRVERVTAFADGDIETVVGNERRGFDANQVNYHLDTGVRLSLGEWKTALVLSHVSRHLSDREKGYGIDWNQVVVRGGRGFGAARRLPLHVAVSLGYTIQHAVRVHYDWEANAQLLGELVLHGKKRAYARLDLRGVTTDGGDVPARSGFLDARLEGGWMFERDRKRLDLFVAYEHRNDVFVTEPGSRDRALFGFRFGLPAEGAVFAQR